MTLYFEDKKRGSDEDDDQNFIDKQEQEEQASEEVKKEVKASPEVKGIIKKLMNLINPESKQLRDLSRETGGLEVEEDKGLSEKDIWDDRSEEVDRMGSVNPIGNSAKKSMIWRQKKAKLDEKKAEKASDAMEAHQQSTKGYNSALGGNQGFAAKIKALRQDHTHENNQGGGGRGM